MRYYVIYNNPSDYPGKYVVRMWRVEIEFSLKSEEFGVFDTLEQARAYIPYGLLCITRSDQDDAIIVETWI